jgi:hypothetical protein
MHAQKYPISWTQEGSEQHCLAKWIKDILPHKVGETNEITGWMHKDHLQ